VTTPAPASFAAFTARYAVWAILAVALGLRVLFVTSGVPYAVGVDEPFLVETAVRIIHSGSLHPHFFDYPGLGIYAQVAVGVIVFMVGAINGAWTALSHFGPADLYGWGRLVTVAAGTAIVWVVYRAGLFWGTRPALIAAGLMAVSAMHVRESHYVLTDVPMALGVAVTFLLTLRVMQAPSTRGFVWVGIVAGLAAGTKYNGVYAFMMPVAAWLVMPSPRPRLLASLVPAAGACAGAFLLVAPYTILDLPAFLDAWAGLARHFKPRSRFAEPGWLLYVKHLQANLGTIGLVVHTVGLGLVIRQAVRGPGRGLAVLALVFPLAYFALISRSALVYGRYLLPVFPFLCLWAAIAIHEGLAWTERRDWSPRLRVAVLVLAVALTAYRPVWASVSFLKAIGTPTPQSKAWAWMDRQLRYTSRIVSEAKGLSIPGHKYSVIQVPTLAGADVTTFANAPAEYLVLSSDAWGTAGAEAAAAGTVPPSHRHLLTAAKTIHTFKPDPGQPGPVIVILRLGP